MRLTRLIGYAWLGVGLVLLAFGFRSNNQPFNYASDLRFGGVVFYALPGVVLLCMAWLMSKGNVWAFYLVILLCIAALVKFVVSAALWHRVQLGSDSMPLQVVFRLPCVLLLVHVLNALPDVQASSVAQSRRRKLAKKGPSEAAATTAPPPPPSSLLHMTRGAKASGASPDEMPGF